MTPPPKKTVAKSPAKKRSKGKGTSKAGRKRASQGKFLSFTPPLLAAFLAGLLMAGVCFWGIYQITGKEQKSPSSVAESSRSVRKAPEPGKAKERAAAEQGRNGTAGKPAPPSSPSSPGAAPQPEARPGTPANGKAAADSASSPGSQEAVASALHDLQSLPYEEPLTIPLEERVRQADYALMQAAWIAGLPASNLRLADVQERPQNGERYHYQVIDILPGASATTYVDALRDCLKTWAEQAELHALEENVWGISFGKVETHRLRLYPGKTSFPGKTPVSSVPSYPQRVRKEGEPAKMVIVIDDLGAGMGPVRQLLQLSYPVTFAFWPHSVHTKEGAVAAHQRGREILVHQPMEPLGYPKVKPGPGVLLVGMTSTEIARQLSASIAKVPHAVGLNNHMGSRFTQNRAGVDAVVHELRRHGLFALDSVTHNKSVFASEAKHQGLVTYRRNVFLDVTASRSSILAALQQAERIALLTGQSVAIGHPLPETLDALREWQTRRNPSVQLVRLRDLARE